MPINCDYDAVASGLGLYESHNEIEKFYKAHENGVYLKFLEDNGLENVSASIYRSRNITLLIPDAKSIALIKAQKKTPEDILEYVKLMYVPRLLNSFEEINAMEYMGPMNSRAPRQIKIAKSTDKANIAKSTAFIYDIGKSKLTDYISVFGISGVVIDDAMIIEEKGEKKDFKKGGLINKDDRIMKKSKQQSRSSLLKHILSGLNKFNYTYACHCAAHALSIGAQNKYQIAQEQLYPAPVTLLCLILVKNLQLRSYSRTMYTLSKIDNTLYVEPWQIYWDHFSMLSTKLYDADLIKKFASASAKSQENTSGHTLDELLDYYKRVYDKPADALVKLAFDYAYFTEMEMCADMFDTPTPTSALKIFNGVYSVFKLFFTFGSTGGVTPNVNSKDKFSNNFLTSPAFLYCPGMGTGGLPKGADICHKYYNACKPASSAFTILSELIESRLDYAEYRMGSTAEQAHKNTSDRQNKKDFILSTGKILISDVMMPMSG